MSLICKCDMCGKLSGMVPFSNSPISVVVNNHLEHKMRIIVDVKIEHEDFINDVTEFKKLIKNNLANLSKGEQSMETYGKLYDLYNKIHSPDMNNPLICDQCKKSYAYQILSKGFTTAQNITKPQLTDIDWQSIDTSIESMKIFNDELDDDYEDDDENNYEDRSPYER